MWQSAWIARADMGSRDPIRGEFQLHEFVHVAHDYHVAIEHYDALRVV